MPLEEVVYRLTGKTALMHNITDRGFIAAGKVLPGCAGKPSPTRRSAPDSPSPAVRARDFDSMAFALSRTAGEGASRSGAGEGSATASI